MFSIKLFRLFFIWGVIMVQSYYLQGQNHQTVSIEPQFGQAISHSHQIDNTTQSKPIGIQIRYSKTFADSVFKSLYHCEAQKGFMLNYTDFRLPLLGEMLALGYFLQPSIQLSNAFSMGLRGTAGLAYATSPNDKKLNPTNYSYSWHVNGYLSLAMQARVKLGERLYWAYIFQLNHISNGGLNKPNWGLNWISNGIGIEYKLTNYPQKYSLPKKVHSKYSAEITTFYSRPYLDTININRLHVAGLSFQLVKRGFLHGFTLGLESTYDKLFAARALDKKKIELNPWLFSAFVGHEFLFGKFTFTQQIGWYAMNIYGAYPTPWYHRWGVNYYISKNVGLGINLKVHQDMANFIDARVIYQLE